MIINASSADSTRNRLTLLWENDNPTEPYDSNTPITIDRKGYEFLLIESVHKVITSTEGTVISRYPSILLNDDGVYIVSRDTGSSTAYRCVTVNDTTVEFEEYGQYTSYAQNGVTSGSNSTCIIPYKIYGYKV